MLPIVTDVLIQCRKVRSFAAVQYACDEHNPGPSWRHHGRWAMHPRSDATSVTNAGRL